jgi:hypothetical protein
MTEANNTQANETTQEQAAEQRGRMDGFKKGLKWGAKKAAIGAGIAAVGIGAYAGVRHLMGGRGTNVAEDVVESAFNRFMK